MALPHPLPGGVADRLPLLQRPHSFYHGTGFQSRNRTLDSARFPGYNKNRRGRRDKRSARFGEIFIRNRHFAEWRFLPFIRIVTVYPRICNVMVIGIASPPFGWCGQPPAVVAAPALFYLVRCFLSILAAFTGGFCLIPPLCRQS